MAEPLAHPTAVRRRRGKVLTMAQLREATGLLIQAVGKRRRAGDLRDPAEIGDELLAGLAPVDLDAILDGLRRLTT